MNQRAEVRGNKNDADLAILKLLCLQQTSKIDQLSKEIRDLQTEERHSVRDVQKEEKVREVNV